MAMRAAVLSDDTLLSRLDQGLHQARTGLWPDQRTGGLRADVSGGLFGRRAQPLNSAGARLCRLDRGDDAADRHHGRQLYPARRRPYPHGYSGRHGCRGRALWMAEFYHDLADPGADGAADLGLVGAFPAQLSISPHRCGAATAPSTSNCRSGLPN